MVVLLILDSVSARTCYNANEHKKFFCPAMCCFAVYHDVPLPHSLPSAIQQGKLWQSILSRYKWYWEFGIFKTQSMVADDCCGSCLVSIVSTLYPKLQVDCLVTDTLTYSLHQSLGADKAIGRSLISTPFSFPTKKYRRFYHCGSLCFSSPSPFL